MTPEILNVIAFISLIVLMLGVIGAFGYALFKPQQFLNDP